MDEFTEELDNISRFDAADSQDSPEQVARRMKPTKMDSLDDQMNAINFQRGTNAEKDSALGHVSNASASVVDKRGKVIDENSADMINNSLG